MIQHRVNNNEITTVELCDNCETYVRDLALKDYLIKDDLLEGHTINNQTITRTEKRTYLCIDCD
tara:strand:+ start:265 stop:456 length:192 start_codon:yes stop_codon:yes gene_type:complete